MTEHGYPVNGRCPICGLKLPTEQTCAWRPEPVLPRGLPPSFMAGEMTIGDEGRAIAAREWQPAGAAEPSAWTERQRVDAAAWLDARRFVKKTVTFCGEPTDIWVPA